MTTYSKPLQVKTNPTTMMKTVFSCHCDKFKENKSILNEIVNTARSYGFDIPILHFSYCPWCGSELEATDSILIEEDD